MKALFVELPAFLPPQSIIFDGRRPPGLAEHLDIKSEAGDVIEGAGGLRTLRQVDPRRSKGKRGGLRVIYFWWKTGQQFWLFTLYDKDTLDDLSATDRKTLKEMLNRELEARR